MNIVLWILQIALALLYISGGAYKVFKFDAHPNYVRALPRGGWGILGIIEMIGGVLLVVPPAVTGSPVLLPLVAAVLALEALGLAALYARYSLKLVAANPLTWSLAMGLLAVIVAYGRYAQL